jgi:hypothetical protein
LDCRVFADVILIGNPDFQAQALCFEKNLSETRRRPFNCCEGKSRLVQRLRGHYAELFDNNLPDGFLLSPELSQSNESDM